MFFFSLYYERFFFVNDQFVLCEYRDVTGFILFGYVTCGEQLCAVPNAFGRSFGSTLNRFKRNEKMSTEFRIL